MEIFAADLAIAVNAELCYVHVSPPKSRDSRISGDAWLFVILDEAAARDHEVLKHAMDVAIVKGVKKATCMTVRAYKIASAIIGIAEKEGFDHIVAGSTGRVGIPRFVVGSIAGGIIHKAHCPVTVVR